MVQKGDYVDISIKTVWVPVLLLAQKPSYAPGDKIDVSALPHQKDSAHVSHSGCDTTVMIGCDSLSSQLAPWLAERRLHELWMRRAAQSKVSTLHLTDTAAPAPLLAGPQ